MFQIADILLCVTVVFILPSVLWHCWLGIMKSIRPVKIEWLSICTILGADDLHMV